MCIQITKVWLAREILNTSTDPVFLITRQKWISYVKETCLKMTESINQQRVYIKDKPGFQ